MTLGGRFNCINFEGIQSSRFHCKQKGNVLRNPL